MYNEMQVSEAALATLQECREKKFKDCTAQFQTLEVKRRQQFGFVKISTKMEEKLSLVLSGPG